MAPTIAAPLAPADAARPVDYASAASSLVTGPEYEATVARLVEMGFPRESVVRALRASFNNPDRAVEFLMSGIPETPAAAPASGGQADAHADDDPLYGKGKTV